MLFALTDYLAYKRRVGRYAKGYRESPMRAAWTGALPEHVIKLLRPGCIIFVQRFNNVGSWAIMYFSQSVSHVVLYTGDRQIVHALPKRGVVKEKVECLYDKDVGLLPSILPSFKMTDQARSDEWIAEMVGRPYGMRIVLKKGVLILTGRDWVRFRWKFAFDLLLLLLIADFVIWLASRHLVFIWAIIAYVGIVLFNALRHRTAPLPFIDETNGVPADAFEFIRGRPQI